MNPAISISRVFGIDAGHRVHGHEGKCCHLHGHRYTITVHAAPLSGASGTSGLDSLGRVIDFSVLKERIGDWLDGNWDHAMLIWKHDPAGPLLLAAGLGQRVFLMPTNPTAENMADYLLNTVCPGVLAGSGVVVWRVEVQETPNCCAVASLN